MRRLLLAMTCNLAFIFALPLLASEKAGLHYHKEKQTFIPQEIQMPNEVVIPAIVADSTVQSPIIKLHINGQGPFLFMFDTGCSQSMISKKLADKLTLPIVKSHSIKTITGNQVLDVFQNVHLVQSLEIGDAIVKNYAIVAASNFEDEAQRFEKLKIDGIISVNIFHSVLLTIDYQNEKLSLKKGALSPKDTNVIAYHQNFDVPVIPGMIKFDKLKKQEAQDFLLDTGDFSYIFVNACHIPEMQHFKDQEKFVRFDLYEQSAQTSFAQLYEDIILSQSIVLNSPYITFSESNCRHTPNLGVLGRKFFEKHQVTLDGKNGLVKIRKY